MKTVAIILARMASTRLPGKCLLPLAGKPALQWCYERVKAAKEVDEVVIATTSLESNDAIRMVSKENGWKCFSYEGDEDDCLGRVYHLARLFDANIIVDITSDCPLVDPQHIDYLVKLLKDTGYNYVSNDVIDRSWPDGFDIQVYTMDALSRINSYAGSNREHTGWNIAMHGSKLTKPMKIFHHVAPENMHYPELSLSLDTAKDWFMLDALMKEMGFGSEEFHSHLAENIVYYLEHHPELITNMNVPRKWKEAGK